MDTRIFPRFEQVTCFYFEFSSANDDVLFALIGDWDYFGFWFLFFDIQLRNLSVLLPKEVLTFNYFDNIPECGHSNYQKYKDKIVDESFRAQPSRWGRGGGHLFVIYSTLIAPFSLQPFNPCKWLASNFSLPYHPWIKY